MTQLPMVRTIFRVPAWVFCVAQNTISLFDPNALMGDYKRSVAAHWEGKIRRLLSKNKRRHTCVSTPYMLIMLRFKLPALLSYIFVLCNAKFHTRWGLELHSDGPVSNQTLVTDSVGFSINVTTDTDKGDVGLDLDLTDFVLNPLQTLMMADLSAMKSARHYVFFETCGDKQIDRNLFHSSCRDGLCKRSENPTVNTTGVDNTPMQQLFQDAETYCITSYLWAMD